MPSQKLPRYFLILVLGELLNKTHKVSKWLKRNSTVNEPLMNEEQYHEADSPKKLLLLISRKMIHCTSVTYGL